MSDNRLQLLFEGRLKTPSRAIAVRSVLGVTLLEMTVRSAETDVKIWANDPFEPDRIAIEIIQQSEGAIWPQDSMTWPREKEEQE